MAIGDPVDFRTVPLSAAVGRPFAWRCLTRCNILILDLPVIDDLLIICLNDIVA